MQDSEVDIAGHEYGNELIRRLVENEDHTATIYDSKDEGKTREIEKKLRLQEGALGADIGAVNNGAEHGRPMDAYNGRDTGGCIAWNPDAQTSEKTYFGKKLPEPDFIKLGHELIHTEHYFSGTLSNVKYYPPGVSYNFNYEEERTVGTIGYAIDSRPGAYPPYSYTRNKTKYFTFSPDIRKTDITENMIRGEHDLPLRPRYYQDIAPLNL